ncbi:MAG TPA: riboflavin synthase [Gemmatales bacterium]|nr:riboflavin synthase [Gemmatales bacterium]
MFTGLVETQGRVKSLHPEGNGQRLVIESKIFDSDIALGESIAINGVCLTVVQHQAGQAAFQLAPETLRRSNLGELQPGHAVNLERALRLGDRLGGHWVQGHVDGLATLQSRQPDGDWEMFVFELPSELGRYVVAKGSITLNGVSLTVVDVQGNQFRVALIPHTLSITNLGMLQPGMQVNVEVDILAKYVEKLLPGNG